MNRETAGRAVVAVPAAAFAAALALGGAPRFIPPWTALFALSAALLTRLWLAERRAGRNAFLTRPDAAVFLLCLTLYLATFRWHGGDDIPNSLLPYAILKHGTLSFDPYREWATREGMVDLIHQVRGRLVSVYPIAPGVVAVPLYAIPVAFNAVPSDPFLHNLSKIAASLLTAGSVVLARRTLARRCSARWAMACALLYGLGTFAYSVLSQALYSQSLAQFGAALGLLGLVEEGPFWSAAGGFGFGLAWAAREDSVFVLAAAGLFVLIHRRDRLKPFVLGTLPPILLTLAYWRHFSGAFRPPYFEMQQGLFGALDVPALVAMILSPSRGLLWFFPALVFSLWGLWRASRDPETRWAPYFAATGAATWILMAFRTSWTGGNTFGTRYFALPCLFLTVFAGELETDIRRSPRLRTAWTWTFAFCVLVHAAGANFRWPGYRMTLDQQAATVWDLKMFPLLQIFVDGGPIDGTPMPWRALYALGLLSLAVLPAIWMRRWISPENGD